MPVRFAGQSLLEAALQADAVQVSSGTVIGTVDDPDTGIAPTTGEVAVQVDGTAVATVDATGLAMATGKEITTDRVRMASGSFIGYGDDQPGAGEGNATGWLMTSSAIYLIHIGDVSAISAILRFNGVGMELTDEATISWDAECLQTTIGAAGGAAALPTAPKGYILVNVEGVAEKVAIPYYEAS